MVSAGIGEMVIHQKTMLSPGVCATGRSQTAAIYRQTPQPSSPGTEAAWSGSWPRFPCRCSAATRWLADLP
jgi:hypothetical protein